MGEETDERITRMYGNNDYRDYLEHSRAHKYILKIGKGIQARYFYTQEEINAFRKKAGKAADQKSREVAKDAANGLTYGVTRLPLKGKAYRKVADPAWKVRDELFRYSRGEKTNTGEAIRNTKRRIKSTYKREVAPELRVAKKKLGKEAKEAQKAGKKIAKNVGKDIKDRWNVSEPAKALRRAEHKRKIDRENKIAVKTKPDRIRRPNNVGGSRPSRAGVVKGSVMFNNPDISHPTVAREYEKREQLARKAETYKTELKDRKKLQKEIAKEAKRKKRREKVKSAITRIKNKPAVATKEFRIRQGQAKPLSEYRYDSIEGPGLFKENYTYTNRVTGNKYTVSERDREKREQLANKAHARKQESKRKKKAARKRKVKRVINSVLRRG